jgi:hypothetical protein
MDNELSPRRGLIIALIVVTILIFVGLLWLIATNLPWSQLGFQSPSATATDQVLQDCAYPLAYWREHPELYPAQIVIGGVIYQQRELEALLTDTEADLAAQIRAQMAVAFLNISRGTSPSSIEGTIFSAYAWLVNYLQGSELSEEEMETGMHYLTLLEAYNLGQAGVVPCEATLPLVRTEMGVPSGTATLLSSSMPSQTSTPPPSETPTPSTPTQTATYIIITPSRTTIPTTRVPPQAPTNTPIPPTERPTPTNTPNPNTPTATPQPPTPTLPPPSPTLPVPSSTLPKPDSTNK